MEDTLVNGSVLIVHELTEGKHNYRVENVVKYKKEAGKKIFVRRGDKLTGIDGIDLQDLTPEELAERLSKGNPMLTVHKAGKKEEQSKKFPSDDQTLYAQYKECTVLNFSWEMTREENTKDEETGEEKDEKLLPNEEICNRGDLLVIQMIKTSISVISGRGCGSEFPCQTCHGAGCTLNDVVVLSESSTVTYVPQGSYSFKLVKEANVSVEHVLSHNYLSAICPQRTPVASPNPESITIYYYKSNATDQTFRGMPVVLNLTDSNCFLSCSKKGEKVILAVETCEKQRLRQISKADESTFAFVFYMKADRTKQRKFESALHQGWFITIVHSDLVEMETPDGGVEDQSFLFVIQK